MSPRRIRRHVKDWIPEITADSTNNFAFSLVLQTAQTLRERRKGKSRNARCVLLILYSHGNKSHYCDHVCQCYSFTLHARLIKVFLRAMAQPLVFRPILV